MRGVRAVHGLALVLVLAIGLGVAGPALAAGGTQTGAATGSSSTPLIPSSGPTQSPFQPGLPQGQPVIPTQTTSTPLVAPTTPSSSSSGLSGSTGLAIGIGAMGLLIAISFFIWRDARRRAPVRAAAAAAAGPKTPGSKRVKPRKLSPAERRRRKRGRAR